MSRLLQDGAVLALGGSKGHTQLSRPFIAGAEAPERAERECVTAQRLLLDMKMVGQAESEEQLQPRGAHCTQG